LRSDFLRRKILEGKTSVLLNSAAQHASANFEARSIVLLKQTSTPMVSPVTQHSNNSSIAFCGVDEKVIYEQVPEEFDVCWNTGNRLQIGERFKEKGVIYALHHIYSKDRKEVVLGVPNNGKMKLFLNGDMIHETTQVVPVRANLGNGGALGDLNNYKVTELKKGWNQVLIKFEIVVSPQDAHFTIGGMSKVCYKNHGMPVLGLGRNLFEWEA